MLPIQNGALICDQAEVVFQLSEYGNFFSHHLISGLSLGDPTGAGPLRQMSLEARAV
jgi:hypothetical protein